MAIYKRKSGRYAVLVDVDRKADGRRQRRPLGTFATRKEAERAEREAKSARDRGVDLMPGTVTVGALLERYLTDRETLGRGAKTLEEYHNLANSYIKPHLDGIALARLRPAHVSAWTAQILKSGGRGERPISARTARHAFALLSSALRWGVRLELAGRNVCEAVTAPSPARAQTKAFTDAEVCRLVEAARGTRWEHFVALALTLAARRGELLGLCWSDVNLEGGCVTIRASLSQTKARVALKSTKSDRVRVIPLSTPAREAFRKQHVLQSQDRLRAGSAYRTDPREPIFTDKLGKQLTPKSATNAFARLAGKARVSTTSLHATRHTAATNLIAGGVDVRTTANILGHATPSITLSLYSHVVEGAEKAAVDVLAGRLAVLSDKRSS